MGAALARQTLGAAYAVDSPPRYHDNGSGGKLLRPENQAENSEVAADIADALVAAGIMKAA